MLILGIETSCDETSAAILENDKVLSSIVLSQDFNKIYGGVVPELSSRAHLKYISSATRQALNEAKVSIENIDLIAATAGPGLIGALLTGFTFAKGISFFLQKPFIAVNHIEGHLYSSFLMNDKPKYPVLTLAVTGGHTLLAILQDEMNYTIIGTTIDDACGEAFDKTAKLLGLEYPGGPKIEKLAAEATSEINFSFPIAKTKGEFDFSFSGLKTAVLRYLKNNFNDGDVSLEDKRKIAKAFQLSAISSLTKNLNKALEKFQVKSLSIVGGVAANSYAREEILKIAIEKKIKAVLPDIKYCGDNAAMIALRGYMLYKNGARHSLNESAFASINQ